MAAEHEFLGQLDQSPGRTWDVDRPPISTPPNCAPSIKAAASPVTLRRRGEAWMICGGMAAPLWLRHSKGLAYLSPLIENPRCQFHVLALIGAEHSPGDAGFALDTRAHQAYRARFEDLKSLMIQAERFGDSERVARARQELEALGRELRRAVGLGGRPRRASSGVERARINVHRCIKDAIGRIAQHNVGLGRYLAATVRTGTICEYSPL